MDARDVFKKKINYEPAWDWTRAILSLVLHVEESWAMSAMIVGKPSVGGDAVLAAERESFRGLAGTLGLTGDFGGMVRNPRKDECKLEWL